MYIQIEEIHLRILIISYDQYLRIYERLKTMKIILLVSLKMCYGISIIFMIWEILKIFHNLENISWSSPYV